MMNVSETAKTIKDYLSALPIWSRVILAFALCLVLSLYVMRESIDKYFDNSTKERMAEQERENQRKEILDSIYEIQAREFWQTSLDDELTIRKICSQYEDYFDKETQISLFKLHDHGDPLAPENNPMITVKWSSLNEIQDNYIEMPAYTGALWILKETMQKGFVYLPSVAMEPNYWIKREKAFHENIGSKSTAFVFVKGTDSSRWFIAIHWNVEQPYENKDLLQLRMEQFAKRISPLIYDAPKHLKNDK